MRRDVSLMTSGPKSNFEGLEIRSVSMFAPSAFLASAAGTPGSDPLEQARLQAAATEYSGDRLHIQRP